MKKVFLTLAFVMSSLFASAQFSAGANVGLPTADANDLTSFSYGVDLRYALSAGEKWNYGLVTGYQAYSGKDGFSDRGYLNLGGNVSISITEDFYVGLDLGYAFGLNPSGDSGGGFYRPMLGYFLTDSVQLNLAYNAIKKDDWTISNLGLGLMFDL